MVLNHVQTVPIGLVIIKLKFKVQKKQTTLLLFMMSVDCPFPPDCRLIKLYAQLCLYSLQQEF